jgi:hypothetical protein
VNTVFVVKQSTKGNIPGPIVLQAAVALTAGAAAVCPLFLQQQMLLSLLPWCLLLLQ